jgi:hypothetical protein
MPLSVSRLPFEPGLKCESRSRFGRVTAEPNGHIPAKGVNRCLEGRPQYVAVSAFDQTPVSDRVIVGAVTLPQSGRYD